MTSRQVATFFLCPLLSVLVAGCGGESSSTDDAGLSGRSETGVASSAGTSGKIDSEKSAARDDRDSEWNISSEDSFEAALPLGEEDMLPLPSPGDRPVGASTESDGLGAERPDELNADDLIAFEPAAIDPDGRGTAADVVGALFRQRDDAKESRSDTPVEDGEQFAAAPPVALADDVDLPRVDEEPEPPRATPMETPFWPRFHGPAGDNKSADEGLLQEWPESGPPLEWTVTGLGYGYSSITTANGLIYTAGNKDGKTVISAIDLGGNMKWQIDNGAAWTASFEGTRGTPTIDGDRVYHQSPLGNIVCLKADSGENVWSANSLERFVGKNIMWALAESLLIDGDRLICCPGGAEASVAALNKLTGETIWASESTGDKAGYSSPSLAEYNGLRMIFVMTARSVIGVNADTGKLLFRHPFKTQYDVNVLQPIFHDGQLFVSGGYGTTGSQLLELEVDGDDVSVSLVWESKDLDNHHGGVMLLDGFLYGAAHKFNHAKWICLDWATGEMKWAERGVGKGSVTYADGLLFMMSEKSQVGLAKPSPEGHEVISQFRLPPGGSGSSWAHPVVCGGRLYLRHADRLFAYNVRAGA